MTPVAGAVVPRRVDVSTGSAVPGPRPPAPGRSSRALRVLASAGIVAFVAGVLVLLFVGYLVIWTGHSGTERAARTVSELERRWAAGAGVPAPSSVPAVAGVSSEPADGVAVAVTPAAGEAFAVVRVPRFGSGWQMPVLEGTGRELLKGGVGHYPGTALPGAVGNLALAGHRTTWGHPFKDVERLRDGDEVIVQTRTARFTYRVSGHQVVDPDDLDVLDPVPGRPGATATERQLTLTTCHPEYSARQRWIVHAVLVSATPA